MPRHSGAGDARPQSKDDWRCKKCKDSGGSAQYKNFGHRDTCNKCGQQKEACFLEAVPRAQHKAGKPPRALAERQVAQGKSYAEAAKRGQTADSLRKENVQLQKRLAAALQQTTTTAVHDDAAHDDAEQGPKQFKYTVESLVRQRAMLLEQGASRTDEDVERLDRQLAVQREAKLSSLPRSVRVAKADKQVESAEKRVADMVARHARLEEERAALDAKVSEHRLGIDKARESLESVKQLRDSLYLECRPDAVCKEAATATPSTLFGALEQVAGGLSDQDLQAAGAVFDKAQLATLLEGLQKVCVAKQQAEAARSAPQAAVEKAAAEAASTTAAAAPAAESRKAWADTKDEESDMEVDSETVDEVRQALQSVEGVDEQERQSIAANVKSRLAQLREKRAAKTKLVKVVGKGA